MKRFDKLSLWSMTNIVSIPVLEDRIYVYEWTIDFATALLELNNFHAAFAVFCGLMCSPCLRLKGTFKNLK